MKRSTAKTMEDAIEPYSDEPSASGYLKEKAKRAFRQEELRQLHANCFPKLKNGLLEIGCGHGHWLTAYAEQHPEQYCVGVDLLNRRITKSVSKASKREIENIRFIKAEAIEFIELIPDGTGIEKVIVLFPDPWPKKRHHRRRLIQHDFLELMGRKMKPGGQLYFRTDYAPYFDWSAEIIVEDPHWELDMAVDWPMELPTYFQDLMGAHQSLSATVKRG